MVVLTALEPGYVALDLRLHAVKPSVNGKRALCGAGAIVRMVSGRLSLDSGDTCTACVATAGA